MPVTRNSSYARTAKLIRLEVAKELVRTEKLDGKDYLVAPVIPIVEGVHNGEFIAFEEIACFPEAWDGRPLTIDHPSDPDGNAITANSPKVRETSTVGYLYNVVAREDLKGISGELWIEIDKANTVPGGMEAMRKLNAGETLEVSTGYFTFVDNLPGEWKNPNGPVEKYNSSQNGVRPDHLALLPYDTGACSWKDGCGSPRVNAEIKEGNDITVESIAGVHMDTEKTKELSKNLTVNGKQLGKVLAGTLAAHAGEDGTPKEMITRLAVAAGVEVSKVQSLIDGTLDFAPRQWLVVFAAVLDIDAWDLFMAASNDNADARYKENAEAEKKIESQEENISETKKEVTIPDTNKSEPCEPCQKSLKVKVQELVTNALESLGITKANVDGNVQETEMEKKARVEALIASDKTQFSDTHREWLLSLNDDQLALLEPKAEIPAVPAAAAPTVAKEIAPEVKPEVKPAVAPTREQVLQALGLTDVEIAAVKTVAGQGQVTRNAKITAILAVKDCPYEKAELENFSDGLLDKTLNILQPADTPFHVAAARQATSVKIPPTPSVLLAAPGVRGVDFAVPARSTK